ncbi:TetR/AcrR family transcriptional regulator [Acidothermaceae bacterium B102]|nr:TetR/AcrR family transcriptional regulator [Acidothermaceae bacterium B102]
MTDVTLDRRRQLLDLAAPLMATRGFHGMSVGDLGAAAGITAPALYRHFPSKQALLGALLTDISERLLAGGEACVAESSDPSDALERLVRWHVAFATSRPDLIRVQDRDFFSMSVDDQHGVRRLQRQYVEVWVRQVLAAHPSYQEDSVRAAIHATFGLLNSTPFSADQLPRPAAEALLSRLALALLRSLGEEPAA